MHIEVVCIVPLDSPGRYSVYVDDEKVRASHVKVDIGMDRSPVVELEIPSNIESECNCALLKLDDTTVLFNVREKLKDEKFRNELTREISKYYGMDISRELEKIKHDYIQKNISHKKYEFTIKDFPRVEAVENDSVNHFYGNLSLAWMEEIAKDLRAIRINLDET